jgi:hypothetical protein
MKKTILLIAGLLMFAFLATGCLGGTDAPVTTDQPVDEVEETGEIAETDEFVPSTAQEKLDIDTLVLAVQSKNPELCKTIENDVQKEDCITKIEDQIIMEEASEELDSSKCNKISDGNAKDRCEIIVSGEIKIAKEKEEIEKEQDELHEKKEEDNKNLNAILKDRVLEENDCDDFITTEYQEACSVMIQQFGW